MQIILWVAIIDSILGILKPPFINWVDKSRVLYLVISNPNKRNYNKVFIFLINSFLFEIRITQWKIFGMAKDLITLIFLNKENPLQLQPFNNPLSDFSIDSKFSL